MAAVLRFAGIYAGIVFALGFMFGVLRVLFLARWTGALAAVLIEIPVILLLASVVVRLLVRRFQPLSARQGIWIGLAAFLLLQILESLAAGLFGPSSYIGNILSYWDDVSAPKLAGLAGQVAFAVLPFFTIVKVAHHERS